MIAAIPAIKATQIVGCIFDNFALIALLAALVAAELAVGVASSLDGSVRLIAGPCREAPSRL